MIENELCAQHDQTEEQGHRLRAAEWPRPREFTAMPCCALVWHAIYLHALGVHPCGGI